LAIVALAVFVQDTGIASGKLALAALQGLLACVLTHVDLEKMIK